MKPSTVAAAVALSVLSLVAFSQERKPSPALASLVETERSFARMSVERGVRASFLAFFAEDGINFQPGPTKTRAAILGRPAPAILPPVTLNWWLVFGDASSAGDLGFTTGPYLLIDNSPRKEPPSYGYFFSVWRRQADGQWRVALDLGVPTPALVVSPAAVSNFTPAKTATRKQRDAGRDAAGALSKLYSNEDDFARLCATRGPRRAFARYLSADARLLRSGELAVTGAGAITSYLSKNVAMLSWKVIGGGAADSGDLGYTYGNYELTAAPGGKGTAERGYYARIWRLDSGGSWRALMNVLHALPPEQNKGL